MCSLPMVYCYSVCLYRQSFLLELMTEEEIICKIRLCGPLILLGICILNPDREGYRAIDFE